MKFQYKDQSFQNSAVKSIIEVFEGQSSKRETKYSIDMPKNNSVTLDIAENYFKNSSVELSDNKILQNIQKVQNKNQVSVDNSLVKLKTSKDSLKEHIMLTVQMETGTGKTFTYIKTIYELYKNYGWSKFIIVVPNIAVREGVSKSIDSTSAYFKKNYGKSINAFVYDSKKVDKISSFANNRGINVMIINKQAFNSRNHMDRRIHTRIDQLRGQRPIDLIAGTNPVMIIDEPQSVLGDGSKSELNATRLGLESFNPLFFISYSATHRERYNMLYRLDALDAYKKKLVKKISVKGIDADLSNIETGYLYIEEIKYLPSLKAKIRFQKKDSKGRIRYFTRLFDKGDNIYNASGALESYRGGFSISEINFPEQNITLSNGTKLSANQEIKNPMNDNIRRIQIRETIKSHLNKEENLFMRGIKTLSLFFIDEVAKYKDYDSKDRKGQYAKIFEEEYKDIVSEMLQDKNINDYYKDYLRRNSISPEQVHTGYFSIDKKGDFIDSEIKKGADYSTDVDAYDLIMKNKEQLLSFEEPVRFIFSHSALREGWDNPNIFQIATLHKSSSNIRKHQEIGRGLRLSINQKGERQDEQFLGADEVHQVNALTIIAGESYSSFANELQSELSDSINTHRQTISPETFLTINSKNKDGSNIDNKMAEKIYQQLKMADIIDSRNQFSRDFNESKLQQTIINSLSSDLKIYRNDIFELIKNSSYQYPIENQDQQLTLKLDREKYDSPEFEKLWTRIRQKSYYTININEDELIRESIKQIENKINIYNKKAHITEGFLNYNNEFQIENKRDEDVSISKSNIRYDLIGEVSSNVNLLRKTTCKILAGIQPSTFAKYKINPGEFVFQLSTIINLVKTQLSIEGLTYKKINDYWNSEKIFVNKNIKGIFKKNVFPTKKHLYDNVLVDSKVEKEFAQELDLHEEVLMYVKLPGDFYINTPVGKYNPDWAIIFNQDDKKHVYFIAETKGNSDAIELNLKGIELFKIKAARKHFQAISNNNVKYDVVDSYNTLVKKLNL